jgi:hypothetical protein
MLAFKRSNFKKNYNVQLVNYSPNAPLGTAGHRFIDRTIIAPLTDDVLSKELSKKHTNPMTKHVFRNILYFN